MKDYRLTREAIVSRPRDDVFAFFADPRNLETITPPWLNFRIATPDPIAMAQGVQIEYRLSIRGIPLTWVSEITVWDPPHRFVDVQVKGPYRKWVHEHRFQDVEGGTEVVDRVTYQVLGGTLVNRFLVRPDIEKIFDFRSRQLPDQFGRLAPTQEKRS